MKYDKATVKEFILNYHKTIENNDTRDEDIGIDDFFNVNDQAETQEIANSNVEDVIFYNELETVIESVATEKEHNLFLLISNGVSFEKAGSIFGVKEPRAKQMFNRLLDKLE
ncbi:sigma-70 family RNA polymerase sigma factor [Staphylococcus saprophyticus]|uniref:sigma-70 family RNA polymerase sigma factor n=1 Tax=Staphylococcus saprophyticus TaxID=29385 RepID=UPI002DBCD7EE|nr:sigma-70 family RNA polymerase sigma factor [Staphylococcus saprophyticus]MEB8115645.1 sigma-70 family RNA polymerase sigma factor [Staphylococcus saprophyticus]